MIAFKGNKQYRIDETQKDAYLADGFDIMTDNGKVVAVSPGKKVSYAQYMELVNENEKLKASLGKIKKA